MQIRISKATARGCVTAPPSKSMAHRMLIAAAMAEGESRISGISDCEDVSATLDCLAALGVQCRRRGNTVTLRGIDFASADPKEPLFCRESGSTLRFLLPLCLLSGKEITLGGAPSLMRRPMTLYAELCRARGLAFVQEGNAITVQGRLPAGDYTLRGDVSSQFITGLLFALSLAGESRIHIQPPLESRSYIDLTLAAMNAFGVGAVWENDLTLYIPANAGYTAQSCRVEGDYSGAAFLEAFNLLGGDVTLRGLTDTSLQGDRVYRKHYAALQKGYAEIDLGDCPDLGPILFALAAACHGGRFTGTRRLRIKESDRAEAMRQELAKFGARVTVNEDSVTVEPCALHDPREVIEAHNDHRIVMSAAVLCSMTGGSIKGAEAVRKSYPDFFDDLRALGVRCEVVE